MPVTEAKVSPWIRGYWPGRLKSWSEMVQVEPLGMVTLAL